MGIPQVIVIGIMGLGLGVAAAKHDKPREGKHNVVMTLFALAVEGGLLYWGGFFS